MTANARRGVRSAGVCPVVSSTSGPRSYRCSLVRYPTSPGVASSPCLEESSFETAMARSWALWEVSGDVSEPDEARKYGSHRMQD